MKIEFKDMLASLKFTKDFLYCFSLVSSNITCYNANVHRNYAIFVLLNWTAVTSKHYNSTLLGAFYHSEFAKNDTKNVYEPYSGAFQASTFK